MICDDDDEYVLFDYLPLINRGIQELYYYSVSECSPQN